MKQLTLFDLPSPLAPTPRTDARYYLYCERDGERYALTASHDNSGPEFEALTELTRQPKLYDSWFGANRAKYYHAARGLQIAPWDEGQLARNRSGK